MTESLERPLRPDHQDALPDMELEEVIDFAWLVQFMHDHGVRYDVLECLSAPELRDFVVALAAVERPGHGTKAGVARETIIDRPVLAHYMAQRYDPETFDTLSWLDRPTYTRVFNDYVHTVWLEPHRAYKETLAQVQKAAQYQVGRRHSQAEWSAMRVRDTFGDD